jgi:hypothetical protein
MPIARWLGSVIYTGQMRNGYEIGERVPEGKTSLGRPRNIQKVSNG